MSDDERYYIIGCGGVKDWDEGRGSLYWIQDRNGGRALPMFTSQEKVEAFMEATFNSPRAHMEMLESVASITHVNPLTEGRFSIFPLREEGVATAAELIEADYIVRDP